MILKDLLFILLNNRKNYLNEGIIDSNLISLIEMLLFDELSMIFSLCAVSFTFRSIISQPFEQEILACNRRSKQSWDLLSESFCVTVLDRKEQQFGNACSLFREVMRIQMTVKCLLKINMTLVFIKLMIRNIFDLWNTTRTTRN